VSSLNLIRWCGMAAVVAGVLSIAVDLVVLAVFSLGQSIGEALISSGLLFRSVAAPLAGVLLLLLGLVGLYARQSGAAGVPGLISFLVAFVGTALAQGSVLAGLLANLGWALFGVSCLRARVYPRGASTLLIVGAVSTGVTRPCLMDQEASRGSPECLSLKERILALDPQISMTHQLPERFFEAS
jgi:hypothetical protein